MRSKQSTEKYVLAIGLVLSAWGLALVAPIAQAQAPTVAPVELRPNPVTTPWPAAPPEPAAAVLAVETRNSSHEQARQAYIQLPLACVENRGQTDTRVRYYAQGSRYAFYLTREEIVLGFVKGSALGRSTVPSTSLVTRGSVVPAVGTAAAVEEPATHGVALALRFLTRRLRQSTGWLEQRHRCFC